MIAGKIYKAPSGATFVYPKWEGLATIRFLGLHNGFDYFNVGAGIPVPTSEEAEFEEVVNEDLEFLKSDAANLPYLPDDLPGLRRIKTDEVRSDYDRDCLLPVDVDGVLYDGGYESASKLYLATELALQLGGTKITFYDTFNDGHEMTIEAGKNVAAMVGYRFQVLLAIKQGLFKQIEEAETAEAINAIIWQAS